MYKSRAATLKTWFVTNITAMEMRFWRWLFISLYYTVTTSWVHWIYNLWVMHKNVYEVLEEVLKWESQIEENTHYGSHKALLFMKIGIWAIHGVFNNHAKFHEEGLSEWWTIRVQSRLGQIIRGMMKLKRLSIWLLVKEEAFWEEIMYLNHTQGPQELP